MQRQQAFLFPGQGSQRVGMLSSAASEFAAVKATFEEASDALGYDVWDLIQHGDADTLALTEFTQPILLSASVALWRAWIEAGGSVPQALAGHSLGEFSALCCAGSISLADAVRLVRERGRFMQTAVPVGEGAMAAVLGLDDSVVTEICKQHSQQDGVVAEAVNFNAPGQVVIAGHTAAVETAIERLKDAGAKRAMPLPVSAPFHTSLMQPAGEKLSQVLHSIDVSSPEIPVIHNVNAAAQSDPAKIKALLVQQISSPVLWTRCLAVLQQQGVTSFVECGPGKVLGGLLRRVDKALDCVFLEQPEDLRAAVAQ
ncbi:MAG: ACP S-malonyltransferase [Congregibacter sp.]